jgi:hypothetical protein
MPKADKTAGRRVIASKLEECIDATNECLGRQKANENDITAGKQLTEQLAERVSAKADRLDVEGIEVRVGTLDKRTKQTSEYCDERWQAQGLSNRNLGERILTFENLSFFGRLRWILTGRLA